MKASKIDETFTVDLTLCSKCQIDGEDFFNFCGLLKGQLISKRNFGVIDFLQKTNENTSHTSINELIRSFFGGNR